MYGEKMLPQMTRKNFAFISIILIVSFCTLSCDLEYDDFGFLNYMGAIVLAIVINFVSCIALSSALDNGMSKEILSVLLGYGVLINSEKVVTTFLLLSAVFSVYSLFIIPSYFCSLWGIGVAFLFCRMFSIHFSTFNIVSGMMLVIDSFLLFLCALNPLADIVIAILFVIVSRSLDLIYYQEKREKAATILLIVITVASCIPLFIKSGFAMIPLIMVIAFILFVSLKFHLFELENQKIKNAVGKTKQELSQLFRAVRRINSRSYSLERAVCYLESAFIYFEINNEADVVNALNYFNEEIEEIDVQEEILGKKNNLIFNEFIEIADDLNQIVCYDCSNCDIVDKNIEKEEKIKSISDWGAADYANEINKITQNAMSRGSKEIITHDQADAALNVVKNYHIDRPLSVIKFCVALNLLNTYVKQSDSTISYAFRKCIKRLIVALEKKQIKHVFVGFNQSDSSYLIVQICDVQFSFHGIPKTDMVDKLINKYSGTVPLKWDGLRKQMCASSIFKLCENIPVYSRATHAVEF